MMLRFIAGILTGALAAMAVVVFFEVGTDNQETVAQSRLFTAAEDKTRAVVAVDEPESAVPAAIPAAEVLEVIEVTEVEKAAPVVMPALPKPETQAMEGAQTLAAAPAPEAKPVLREQPVEVEVETAGAAPALATTADSQPNLPEIVLVQPDLPDETRQAPVIAAIAAVDAGEGPPVFVGISREGLSMPSIDLSTPLPPLSEASPLLRFAAKAETGDGPRISIILIDDGAGPWGPHNLADFPFPISLALDANHPDAIAAAEGYRALGFDILALTDLGSGGGEAGLGLSEQDKIQAVIKASAEAVPGSIGVLESPDAPTLPGEAALAEQAARAAQGAGLGLVMLPGALNVAAGFTAKEGLPSVTVFRDFDRGGENSEIIRRFLDSATEKARAEGTVVMLGRLKAETISGLVRWGLEADGGDLARVPVSVVLQEAAGEG